MLLTVEVKPNRAKESVEVMGKDQLRVTLTVPPIEGKANKALQKILAKHFHVAPSCVVIEKGKTSRIKQVEIIV